MEIDPAYQTPIRKPFEEDVKSFPEDAPMDVESPWYSFTVPGSNWIGPGTNIHTAGEPQSEADALAKIHDLTYWEIQQEYNQGKITKLAAHHRIALADQLLYQEALKIKNNTPLNSWKNAINIFHAQAILEGLSIKKWATSAGLLPPDLSTGMSDEAHMKAIKNAEKQYREIRWKWAKAPAVRRQLTYPSPQPSSKKRRISFPINAPHTPATLQRWQTRQPAFIVPSRQRRAGRWTTKRWRRKTRNYTTI